MILGISVLFDVEYKIVEGYFNELEQDEALHSHLKAQLKADGLHDSTPRFGRRIVWYAVTRITRPSVVVETGVEKGIGAMVLLRALKTNRDESGLVNRYVGTDIDPTAGRYIPPDLMEFGQIIIGDSLESCKMFDFPIDMFVNDSDHAPEYEEREYEAIAGLLQSGSVVISDNSHSSGSLAIFAKTNGGKFLFLREQPEGHWYPGGVSESCGLLTV